MEENTYLSNEVEKIFNDKSLEFPLNMAMTSTWILGNLKGINLKILSVAKSSSLAYYYVLASASNSTQMRSMADQISKQLGRFEVEIKSKEGFCNADWLLMDCGDIIIHIFLESSRETYDLDNLWRDAKNIEIPSSYYFSFDGEEAPEPDTKDYF